MPEEFKTFDIADLLTDKDTIIYYLEAVLEDAITIRRTPKSKQYLRKALEEASAAMERLLADA